MKRRKKILILGVGNVLHKDDGIGVHVVKYLKERDVNLPDNVDVIDGGTAGINLISFIVGYDKLVIVDALNVDDTPGSVYKFDGCYLKAQSPNVSLHEMSIAEVLHLLHVQGYYPEVEVIGVVPEDISTIDTVLSPSVEASIPKVVDVILDSVSAN